MPTSFLVYLPGSELIFEIVACSGQAVRTNVAVSRNAPTANLFARCMAPPFFNWERVRLVRNCEILNSWAGETPALPVV
jgi:hypothetical protein